MAEPISCTIQQSRALPPLTSWKNFKSAFCSTDRLPRVPQSEIKSTLSGKHFK
ncbi:hypothetical protein EVA_03287 [gut metagenome]|uniref:Uncharacterized protein n=1 Tax=gut metagenome TaxID=749906 RepID=J9H4C2_9ZZZZ